MIWDSDHGFWGKGDVKGKSYSETPANTVKYAKSTTMSLPARDALRMQKSYSIEAVFRPETLPTAGGTNNTYMGIVSYTNTTPNPDTQLYKLGIYKSGSNTYVYYSATTSPTSSAIAWNTTASGMTIGTSSWYYIGAFYDASNNTMKFQLRNLTDVTGAHVESGSYTMNPLATFGASPNPLLLIGAETTSTKGFDGWIDEVRISNSLLGVKDRLYMNNSTVAHWKFDGDHATDDQVIDNVDSDLLLNLHLGKSFAIEGYDATIEHNNTDWFGGSLRSQSYVDNGNITKYASSEDAWSLDEAEALAFSGSYSIETVFKVDSFPTTGGGANTEMGLVTYRDYKDESTGDDDVTLYEIKTYKNSSGHTCIKFSSVYNTSGDKKDILWDTLTDSGYTIPTGQWLYLGAFFNSTTNTMDLYLKNLETGIPYPSKTGASMNLPVGLSGNPTPVLLIGSNTRGSRCLDGWIDEVRISNEYLPSDSRLYNYPR